MMHHGAPCALIDVPEDAQRGHETAPRTGAKLPLTPPLSVALEAPRQKESGPEGPLPEPHITSVFGLAAPRFSRPEEPARRRRTSSHQELTIAASPDAVLTRPVMGASPASPQPATEARHALVGGAR
jgi:hypothetical protein